MNNAKEYISIDVDDLDEEENEGKNEPRESGMHF